MTDANTLLGYLIALLIIGGMVFVIGLIVVMIQAFFNAVFKARKDDE